MSQYNENAGQEESASKILVIDDESDLCKTLKKLFTDDGFFVITAAGGIEGIQKNRESDPDVIILDIKMPDMGGLEVLREIRKIDKDVQVIILTGYGDVESIREAANLDVFEYVSKPFRNAMIIDCVKEALAEGQ